MVAGALGRLAIGQLGQSLDGRIATPTGKSHYINGADGRRHLHRLRALADAVIVGTGTVTADNPRLTVRLVSGPNPVRVVVDPQMRSPAERAIFAGDGPETWVLTRAAHLLGERRAQPLDLPDTPAEILDLLAARGCRVVLVEGGTATLSRFLEAGALDRLHLMIAPLLIGSGHPGFDLPPIDTLEQARRPAVHWLPLGPELLADVQLSGDDRHVD
ncbi:MAG: RibD family protein [Rhodospirillaceae bacterium]|nr:RibD family protein [Rhodospirillaceae bacterium]